MRLLINLAVLGNWNTKKLAGSAPTDYSESCNLAADPLYIELRGWHCIIVVLQRPPQFVTRYSAATCGLWASHCNEVLLPMCMHGLVSPRHPSNVHSYIHIYRGLLIEPFGFCHSSCELRQTLQINSPQKGGLQPESRDRMRLILVQMANCRRAGTKSMAVLLTVAIAFCLSSSPAAAQGLQLGYYNSKCPGVDVESIVSNSMRTSFSGDRTVAPGVLRLAFHDCFVRGCDASLLLDTPDSEKASPINRNLQGFEAIDAAKVVVEAACPGVVSCADILQFAARDAVVLTGGQGWDVSAGRRDGTVSNSAEPLQNLPTPFMRPPQLISLFSNKGLSAAQMVVLSGSHTIGIARCNLVADRLYTFNSTTGSDPSIPADFLASLKAQCPSATSTSEINMDEVSPGSFDPQYFTNIVASRGLLTSDQSLLDDSRTEGTVLANNGPQFLSNFGTSMQAMAEIGVLTGSDGQIRTNCRRVL